MSTQQAQAEQRGERILAVFDTAFGELLAADPAAFRVKFRKMAASAFAFYRGTACLFYADLDEDPAERDGGPYLDERTSGSGSTAICTRRTSARTWTPTVG
ncbi:DUF2252 family protein [Streptomyces sp. M19]